VARACVDDVIDRRAFSGKSRRFHRQSDRVECGARGRCSFANRDSIAARNL
jgi:hypothetical protein